MYSKFIDLQKALVLPNGKVVVPYQITLNITEVINSLQKKISKVINSSRLDLPAEWKTKIYLNHKNLGIHYGLNKTSIFTMHKYELNLPRENDIKNYYKNLNLQNFQILYSALENWLASIFFEEDFKVIFYKNIFSLIIEFNNRLNLKQYAIFPNNYQNPNSARILINKVIEESSKIPLVVH